MLLAQPGRSVEVIGGLLGEEGYRILHEPVAQREGLQPRIDATVSYKTDGKPASAEITLYGPPPGLAADLLQGERRAFVGLRAGRGNTLSTIFAGRPSLRGVDLTETSDGSLVLKISALSGGRKWRRSLVSISQSGRVPLARLAQDVAEQAGWRVDRNDINPELSYTHGFAATSLGPDVLNQICRDAAVDLLVLEDSVSFVNLNRVLDVGMDDVPLFSQADGSLVGFPKNSDKGASFTAIFSGFLRPGDRAVLEYPSLLTGQTLREIVTLRDVQYKISTHESAFYMDATTWRRVRLA